MTYRLLRDVTLIGGRTFRQGEEFELIRRYETSSGPRLALGRDGRVLVECCPEYLVRKVQ